MRKRRLFPKGRLSLSKGVWQAGGRGSTLPAPLPESAMPTGVFRRIPENRRNWGLQFMVPNFVCCPAAASGCRPCLPDRQSTKDFVDSENSGILIYGSRIRRQNPRQQVGAGSALPQLLRGTASDSLQTKNPEASIYGRRIRLGFGGSKWVQALPARRQQVAVGPACPAAASGCRPCRPGGSRWLSALPTGRAAS